MTNKYGIFLLIALLVVAIGWAITQYDDGKDDTSIIDQAVQADAGLQAKITALEARVQKLEAANP